MFKPIRTLVETIVRLAPFLHSDVFTAFWSFPSYLDHYLIARSWSARERSAWYEIRNLCNKQGSSSSSSLCDPLSFLQRTDQNRVRTQSSIRSSLGPVNIDKSCPGYLDHSPSPATLGEPTFHTFSYKTWRTVYMKNKRLRSLGRSFSTYL